MTPEEHLALATINPEFYNVSEPLNRGETQLLTNLAADNEEYSPLCETQCRCVE
jgi:hypothetical protein